MKRKLVAILTLCVIFTLCIVGLTACGDSNGVDNRDQQIVAVYNTYVSNVQENGQTPLSYEEWLKSIKGEKGDKGDKGQDGKSAYQIWLDLGNSGSEQDFLNWLKGQDGANGTNGVGIESVRIDENGHLKIKYTNSEQEVDLGKIKETETYSKGLDFELNEEQTGYILTGIGYCNDRKVVIPSEYNDKPVVAIGEKAFYQDGFIKVVEIPDSVTSIGNYAFDYCDSLESVYYNGTIEDWCKIEFSLNSMAYTEHFYMDGKEVTEIEIPSSITNIKDYTFYRFDNLTKVTIPSSVTSIGFAAFAGCSSLESIEIPSSVTSIGFAAFSGCSNLKSVTFGENSKLESIVDGAFDNCKSLESIEIPSSVTSIGGYAFQCCSNLKSVTFGENSKLESIGDYAFHECTSLESIEIPSSVTSIGFAAFRGCSKLTIYCQATSKPSGWSSDWNISNRPVVWGYKG